MLGLPNQSMNVKLTHTQTYMYIYVCVCVCAYIYTALEGPISYASFGALALTYAVPNPGLRRIVGGMSVALGSYIHICIVVTVYICTIIDII